MMVLKLLLVISATAILLPLSAMTALPSSVLAQEENSPIRIEVSYEGFDQTPGRFELVIEAGQEVEIIFVYGDNDLPENNPHIIFISGYNIKTDTLDQQNPEVTVNFYADKEGEFNFMCILDCEGHDELQKGRLIVIPSTEPPTSTAPDQPVTEPSPAPTTPEQPQVEQTPTLSAPEPTPARPSLTLSASGRSQVGQPLTLPAVLRNNQGDPIENATVKFYTEVDFFTTGLVELGEVITNQQGVATFKYIPHVAGAVPISVRYRDIETTTAVILTEADKPFYQPEAGIRLPALGEEVLVGLESLAPEETGAAPVSVFRLPGGILSWLLLFTVTVMLIWATYFRVLYQVFRIPGVTGIADIDSRRAASAGMAAVVLFGILLVLLLVTGPDSHPHLPR
jgi:hypothetical protein